MNTVMNMKELDIIKAIIKITLLLIIKILIGWKNFSINNFIFTGRQL